MRQTRRDETAALFVCRTLVFAALVLAPLVLVPGTASATDVSGPLVGDVTWGPQGNPWIVKGDVTVPADGSLTVQAGTLVRFSLTDDEGTGTTRTELVIEGLLLVEGTAAEPATFTTLSPLPARGQWEGITLTAGAIADVSHAVVEYAVNGINLGEAGAYGEFTEVTARQCSTHGLHAAEYSDVVVTRGHYSLNASCGIYLNEGTHVLTGVTAFQNSVYGVAAWMGDELSSFQASHLSLIGNGHSGFANHRSNERTVITLRNSVVALNTRGIYGAGTMPADTDYNCVYRNNNGSYDYAGSAVVGAHSFRVNPLLQNDTVETGLALTHRSPARFVGEGGTDLGAWPYVDAQTVGLQGTLWEDYTLAAGATVTAVGDVTVPAGVTLTVSPGATMKFASSDTMYGGVDASRIELIVRGRLVAGGAEGSRITFKGEPVASGVNTWYGIRIVGGGNHVLHHADVFHGYNGVLVGAGQSLTSTAMKLESHGSAGFYADAGSVLDLSDSTIKASTTNIYLADGQHRVTRCLLTDATSGLTTYTLAADTEITLDHLTVYNNGTGLYLDRRNQGSVYTLRDLLVFRNPTYGIRMPQQGVTLDHVGVWDNYNGGRDWVGPVDLGPVVVRANPLVVDADGGDFRLTDRSPARHMASDGGDLGAFPFDGALTGKLMGILREDLVLTAAGSPWVVEGDFTVPQAVTLTVEPGAEVQFLAADGMEAGVDRTRVELIVDGTLQSGGTPEAPIVYQSAATSPGANDWYGIHLTTNASEPVFRHARLRHAYRALTVQSPDDLTLSDIDIRTCGERGMTLAGTGRHVVTGSRIVGTTHAILVGDAVDFDGVPDGEAHDVLIERTIITRATYGILGYQSNPDASMVVDHVTLYANNYGYYINKQSALSVMELRSSIISSSVNWAVYRIDSSTYTAAFSHNDVWNPGNTSWCRSCTLDANTISSNPLYVDAATEDLHLTALSPCRDAAADGTDIGALPYDGAAQGELAGVLREDLTLGPADEPWMLTGDLIVPVGVTLTLLPGADVRFALGDAMAGGRDRTRTEIIVFGSFVSVGTAEAPVLIRSGAANPAANDWSGIQLRPGSVGHAFEHTKLYHAWRGVDAETADAVAFTDVEFRWLGEISLNLVGAGAFTVHDCRFRDVSSGINIGSDSWTSTTLSASVTRSIFTRLSGNGILVYSQSADDDITIDHNTIYSATAGTAYYTYMRDAEADIRITNNIAARVYHGVYNYDGAITPTAAANTVHLASHRTFYLLSGDPGFVDDPLLLDPDAEDFQLTHRSPCRAAATDGGDIGAVPFAGALTPELRGTLHEDLTLTAEDGPHTITGDIIVPAGITMTIEPGAVLRLGPGDAAGGGRDTGRTEIIVFGSLRLLGTAALPVTLESGAGTQAANDWWGVQLRAGSSDHVMDHVIVKHAAYPFQVETTDAVTWNAPRVSHGTGHAFWFMSSGVYRLLDGVISDSFSTGVHIGLEDKSGGPLDVEVRRTVVTRVTNAFLIYSGDAEDHVLVDHNTVWNCPSGTAYWTGISVAGADIRVLNNIADGVYHGYYNAEAFKPDLRHNLMGYSSHQTYRDQTPSVTNLTERALLVDPDGGDFAPTHRSPARFADTDGNDLGAVPFAGARTPVLAGHIHEDMTLTLAGSPYILAGDLTVPAGRSLTIEPGVVLKASPVADLQWTGGDQGRVELHVFGTLRASGTPDAPITFTTNRPVPARNDWIGLEFHEGSRGNVLEHLVVLWGQTGVTVQTAEPFAITDSTVRQCNARAIYVDTTAGPTTIERCTMEDNGGWAVEVLQTDVDLTVASSVLARCYGGISLTLPNASDRFLFVNNTVHGNANTGAYVLKTSPDSTSILENNLFTSNGGYGVHIGTTWDSVVDYNLFQGNYGTQHGIDLMGEHNLVDTEPLYVDTTTGDLRLQDESQAIDAASVTHAPARDRDGLPRVLPSAAGLEPAPDMGAYEFDYGTPLLLSLTPASVQQGTTTAMTLTGARLPDDIALAFSGAGATVSDLVRVDAETLTFTLTVADDAPTGRRDAVGTWDPGTVTAEAILRIVSGPAVTVIDPNVLLQGDTVRVTVQGRNFLRNLNVYAGAGVTASAVQFESTARFSVLLRVSAQASPGPRDVTLVNPDGGTTTVAEGLTIERAVPGPRVTLVAPASAARGALDVPLTVTGEHFQSGALVRLTGTGVVLGDTRFQDAGTLLVDADVAESAPLGARDVIVVNPDGGLGRLVAGFSVVTDLAIDGLDPARLVSGTMGAVVSVIGNGFEEDAVFTFVAAGPGEGGAPVVTDSVFLGSTRYLLTVDASGGVPLGAYDLQMIQGDESAALAGALTIVDSGELRVVSASPALLGPGVADVAWTVNGANFEAIDTIEVSGGGVTVADARTVSTSAIGATLSVAPDAAPGPRDVTFTFDGGVVLTAPGLIEVSRAPALTAAVPAELGRGAAGHRVVLTCAYVQSGAGVDVTLAGGGGGVTVAAATLTDATHLTLTLTVAEDAALGARDVTVTNPDGGAATATGLLTVVEAPSVASIAPSTSFPGAELRVTVAGERIRPGATLAISGSGIAVSDTAVQSGALLATLTIAPSALSGPRDVTVVNADGGSATLSGGFTVKPVPLLYALAPNALRRGSAAVDLVLTGANFQDGATVAFLEGGVTAAATFTSAARLELRVDVDIDATLGQQRLVVTNPDGGQSAPAALLTVLPAGAARVFALTPESLFFQALPGGAMPPAQTIAFDWSMPPSSAWTAVSDQPWLTVTPAEGTTPGEVEVTVDPRLVPAELAAYPGTVTILADGEIVDVPVTLEIVETIVVGSRLSVVPQQFDLDLLEGQLAQPQQMMVRAADGAIADWTATSDQTWVRVEPPAGRTPQAANVSFDVSGLAVRTAPYVATITVTAPALVDPVQTVRVRAFIRDPSVAPIFVASPVEVVLGAPEGGPDPLPAQIGVSVDPGGRYAFAVEVVEGADWLTVAPDNGETPGYVSVRASVAGLTADASPYTGLIRVSGGSPAPVDVPVTLHVGALPPVANAGADRVVEPSVVALDAGASRDGDGQPVAGYAWTVVSVPEGVDGDTLLDDPTSATPTMLVRAAGEHVFSLVVTDGDGRTSAADRVTVTVAQVVPMADAGVGLPWRLTDGAATIALRGERSADANGDALGYLWTQTGGRPATIADRNAATTTATVAAAGVYTFELRVLDDDGAATPTTVAHVVHASNDHVPVADAGPDRRIRLGERATLNGTASGDSDGDTLRYTWQQTYGQPVTLESAESATPSFVTPYSGRFDFELVVHDDHHTSPVDRVSILIDRPDDGVPTADAGPDQDAWRADLVHVSSVDSSDPPDDPEGEALTINWSFRSGLRAPLQTPQDAVETAFFPVLRGVYRMWLEVTDGRHWSTPDVVRIVVDDDDNQVPRPTGAVATLSEDGAQITLDATAAVDGDEDALTARWRQVKGPGLGLDDPEALVAHAAPSAPGTYVWELSLDDGTDRGPEMQVELTIAPPPNEPPVADAGDDVEVEVGDQVLLDGGGSEDPEGAALTYRWTLVSGPVLVPVRPESQDPTMTFVPGVAGTYVFALIVRDGEHTSAPDEVTVVVAPGDVVITPDEDSDGDGLSDEVEDALGTSPTESDSDGDGLADGLEVPDPDHPRDTDDDDVIDALDPDDDGDGIPTAVELPHGDTDRDGTPDYLDTDDDDDGVDTLDEGDGDTDGDRTPDYLDTDDDGDGVTTIEELPRGDTDGDDTPDYLDGDDDGDGLRSVVELPRGDSDGDGTPDYLDPDDDGDGVDTKDEVGRDTDHDGVPDPLDGDDDGDGVATAIELPRGDTDGDDTPDYLDDDDDGDSVLTRSELARGDTDGDGTPDYLDPDDEGDGVPTLEEARRDSDGDGVADDLDRDDDGDGVATALELPRGDTDGDETVDYLDPDDDGDGVPTAIEVLRGDSDGDQTPDYLDTDDDGDGQDTAVELPRGDTDGDGLADVLDRDDDGDGVASAIEVPRGDTDGDDIPDVLDPDDDGDGVPTITESPRGDTDGDGTIDPFDTDDDGDGQDTAIELARGDSDGDGTPDFLDKDDDGDGVASAVELPRGDTDGDDTDDVLDTDDDGDGAATAVELPRGDTDDDGVPDYLDDDDDGDGLLTSVELPLGDSDSDGTPDYADSDDDGDGVLTATELPRGDSDDDGTDDVYDTDDDGDGQPTRVELSRGDTDGDDTPDYLDTDDDGDTLPSSVELPRGDTDRDGAPDPIDDDDDGDGVLTKDEIAAGDTDKDDVLDYLDDDDDGDGIPTATELPRGDTDGDETPDYLDTDDDDDGKPSLLERPHGDTDGDGLPNPIDDDDDGDGVLTKDEPRDDMDGDGIEPYLDRDEPRGPVTVDDTGGGGGTDTGGGGGTDTGGGGDDTAGGGDDTTGGTGSTGGDSSGCTAGAGAPAGGSLPTLILLLLLGLVFTLRRRRA